MVEIFLRNQAVFFGGLATTALASAAAIMIGALIGLALSRALVARSWPVCRLAGLYRSFWRGTPLLVQLFLFFYLLPLAGVEVPPVACAILVLALNTAAFQGEIFRAGFSSIPGGQLEAARMLGIPARSIFRRIELPQMLRLVLPALTNEIVAIVKNSSLVSVIAVTELMRRSQQLAASSFRPFEVYAIAALLYLALAISIAILSLAAERRLAVSGALR